MIKINEAVYNEDIGILQVVLDDGVVEHINPTEENDKFQMGVYSRSQLDKLLDINPAEYAEMVLNGELERYIELCNAEGKELSELGMTREFMMYDS